MDNALGQPQTIVLLGGTSEIGLAIVRELLSPTTRTVVLACRDIDAGERAGARPGIRASLLVSSTRSAWGNLRIARRAASRAAS